jgi:hypothetical protein
MLLGNGGNGNNNQNNNIINPTINPGAISSITISPSGMELIGIDDSGVYDWVVDIDLITNIGK